MIGVASVLKSSALTDYSFMVECFALSFPDLL